MADTLRLIQTAPPDLDDEAEVNLARLEGLAAVLEAQWSRIIPAKFVKATLDAEGVPDEAARHRLRMWAAHTKPPNLVLLGPWGTGKSSGAVAAVRLAFERHLEIMFAPIREALEMLRQEYDGGQRGALGELCAVDRLIIDDLGTEKPSEWTMERLGMVVDRRWSEERATVFTSNLNQKDLEAFYGGHMASRMFGGAEIIVLRGPDRRMGR